MLKNGLSKKSYCTEGTLYCRIKSIFSNTVFSINYIRTFYLYHIFQNNFKILKKLFELSKN